jgi:hypothetical protein
MSESTLRKVDELNSSIKSATSKKQKIDPDTMMTMHDLKILKQSIKELKEGKTTSLNDLKKELGI